MPSSSSIASSAPLWRATRKWGSSGIESSDTKPKTSLLHLARRAQHAHVGPAVGDDGEVA